MEAVCVKSEPEEGEDACGVSEAAAPEQAGCLSVHKVEDEQDWESEAGAWGVSEAAAREGLYKDHQVKDELVVGPEILQPPDAVFALQAPLSQVEKGTCAQETLHGRTCSVSLERVFVDTDHQTCQVGLQTYKLWLCPQGLQSLIQDENETNAMESMRRTSLSQVEKETCAQETLLGRTCSVSLERVFVDTDHQTCQVGLQTYKLRLCPQGLRSLVQDENETNAMKSPRKNAAAEKSDAIEQPVRPERIAGREAPLSADTCRAACRATSHDDNNSDVAKDSNITTEKETFVCDICKKRFTLKSQLLEHVMIHIHQSTEQEGSVADNGQMRLEDQRIRQKTNKSQLCVRGLKKGNAGTAEEQAASVSCQVYSETDAANEMRVVKHLTANKTKVMCNDNCNNHFTCDSCSRAFGTKLMLLEHFKRTRHGENCSLLGHERIHTGEKKYKCTHCSYASVRRRNLLRHEKIHTGEKPYKCAYCSFASAYRQSLLSHEKIHTGEKPYKCAYCSYASAHRYRLQIHEKIHTGEKPHKCAYCSYASVHRNRLLSHERIHTGEKPYKCAHCSYASIERKHLLNHERIHTGEKPYKCAHCSYATIYRQHLLSHERIHTGEKSYKCAFCSFASAYRQNLLNHERIHTGEKPYKCAHCSYATIYRQHLLSHERIHTGEKSYKCAFCSFASAYRQNLLNHERIHTGEKPYKCAHCSYATIYRQHLISHERIHTGEKSYKCAYCSFASAHRQSLLSHERIHTGEKPYKCAHCSYASARRNNLLKHERIHTREKPYKCGHCNFSCACKKSLLDHERLHTAPNLTT